MRRVGYLFLVLLVAVLIIAGAGLLVVTRTDFGRERVRRFVVSTLQGQVDGIVKVGRITGNLLDGITLHDISITDSTGAPLVVAERISTKYRVLDFAKKRIALHDLELVRPLIVLDRQPGESKWNYQKLFPGDTTTKEDTGPGWGDWLSFRNVSIIDGRFLIRTPWEPSDELAPEQRAQASEEALAGGTRSHVIRASNGGLQKEMEFRELNTRMPLVRLADPEEATRLIEVATLQTIAALFNPPDAEIRDLKGTFELTGDSAWWSGMTAKLPASQLSGSGRYAYESGDMRLRLVGAPVNTADLRWLFPQLPADGEGKLEFAMDWIGDTAVYVARNADLRIERAQLAGNFGITLADSVTFHDTDLRFSNLGTRLIQQIAPAAKMPRHGTLAGRAAIAGGLNALDIDADVAFDDEQSGRSRVIADGELGVQSAFRAKQLKLNLAPVQVDLVKIAAKDFPVGGTLRGTVTVDGSSKGWLASAADLTHEQGAERSHILGRGEMRLGQERWMDIDVRATPVSLVTVGRFAPAAELQGQAAGPITVTGPFSNLAVRADLAVTGGGRLAVRGTMDLASDEIGYNLGAVADLFNANVVIARLPQTSLTATASARGRGFDPATMRADFSADLATSVYDSLAIDSAKVRVAIADGMAHVDTLVLRAPSSRADIQGTFGLTGGREGRMVYTVAVDSLGAFSRWLPAADTGVVEPRPGIAAKVIAQARADSIRIAEANAVEMAVTGRATTPVPTVAAVDTPTVVRKDSLAGSIYAAGTLEGSVSRFDARGRAGVEGLVYGGNQVRHGRIEYGFVNGGTDKPAIAAGLHLDSALVAGFALDSVDGRISYQGERGNVAVVINQAERQQYSAAVDFTLHADHREVHLNQLALQFDTTYWNSARPGTIRWGGRGIEVQNLDLRSGSTGRIYVNGVLPTEGAANLDVEVDNFEVGNLVSLLQSDLRIAGLVSLTADIQGTTKAPRLEGAIGVERGMFRGAALPSLHGTFDYADEKLTARANASAPGGPPLITAEGTVPINLGSGGGPRLPDAPMSVDVTIDQFPLAYIPPVTDAIRDLKGTAVGRVAARGTIRDPQLAGALEIGGGAQAHIAPLGITLANLAGSIRMAGDSVVIDSIAASSGGRILLTGGLGVADLTKPAFDLKLTADNAKVLDSDRGDARIDAQIAIKGPFDGVNIDGQATVLNAVYYIPESDGKKVIGPGDPAMFNVVDTAVVDGRTLFPGQSPLLANMRMNVAVSVNRDTWIRSRDANVEIYSDGDLRLNVDRAKQALALEGIVTTERGQYTFLGRRFDVRRGSATFIGGESGLNPTLQVTAEHLVQLPASEAITIRVVLGGTLERPTIALTSDAQPPLTQSDLLSYVAFGRTSSSLLQLGGSSVASEGTGGVAGLGTFATQKLFGIALGVFVDELEGEAARSLGADVLNITPADVYAEVTQGQFARVLQSTELEVGRYFNPETFGSVQTRFSLETPPGLRLNRRLWTDYRIEASFEPRLALRTPSLTRQDDLPAFSVLGLFLIREWKF